MANRMRQMALATGARIVVRRPRPVNTGRIPPGADEMTVGRHLRHLVTVGTRHGGDAMTAGRHLHLGLAETSIGAPTVGAVTGVIDASHTTPRRAVSSSQRLGFEEATSFAFAFSATPRERTGPGPFS